ncbi:hypothetical protein Amet_2842 [Alkaliphilus metalliredigens QYMF]|uniref:DUF5659 domain-containing protein n=1 Tax=Alkaliphilus metalliredigens (strain QYMF) TaxID=293826 RepID=A6TS24_ALKMQ|nr:DUF5659 domain-containing protein [Alkaliphilus metalliredigens]ABR48992.1 hypothetical protein Amet_2842 [Alkaliphilus metalliredigens QYMF]
MMGKNDNVLFYIFSIHLIAYLRSIGIYQEKVTTTETGKKAYWFKNNRELQQHIQDYKGDWELQEFIKALRKIKGEMVG